VSVDKENLASYIVVDGCASLVMDFSRAPFSYKHAMIAFLWRDDAETTRLLISSSSRYSAISRVKDPRDLSFETLIENQFTYSG
jgi:hypothetical protein